MSVPETKFVMYFILLVLIHMLPSSHNGDAELFMEGMFSLFQAAEDNFQHQQH